MFGTISFFGMFDAEFMDRKETCCHSSTVSDVESNQTTTRSASVRVKPNSLVWDLKADPFGCCLLGWDLKTEIDLFDPLLVVEGPIRKIGLGRTPGPNIPHDRPFLPMMRGVEAR